jgi:hypothetical protein
MSNICRKFTIVCISILLLWIWGCIDVPTSVKAPQWDVDLNLPLVNRSYSLDDIIKKQNYISSSSVDSIFVIQSDIYPQHVDVTNFIQLNNQTSLQGVLIPVVDSTNATIYIPLPNGTVLENAVFTSGFMSFNVVNTNSQDVNIVASFPAITQNGRVLSISMTVPAFKPDSILIPLAGCVYAQPANQLSQNQSSIQIVLSCSSFSLPLGSIVTMDFYCSNFSFSSATGVLPERSLGTKSQSYSINLGDAENFRDKVFLESAELDLNLNYYSSASNPFNYQVKDFNLTGVREEGTQMALTDSTGNSNITVSSVNGSTQLSFTQANSNITSFITFMPSTLLISAEYIMNPNNTTGTVTNQDSIVLKTNFSTKSILALQKTYITDTVKLNISNQDSLKIQDTRSAYVNINIQNGIPLDSWLTLNFVDAHYNPLFTLSNSNNSDSIYFAAAGINSAGEVRNTVTTNNMIQLDSAQTAKLAKAQYAIYTVAVQTSGASNNSSVQYVSVRPGDQLQITIYGGVQYHVNTNDLK